AFWSNPHVLVTPSYAENGLTWNADFAGVWHLNDDEADSSPNANDGRSVLATNVAGIIAAGRGFNGTSSYIQVPNSPSMEIAGTMITVSGWFNQTGDGPNDAVGVFGKDLDTSQNLGGTDWGVDIRNSNEQMRWFTRGNTSGNNAEPAVSISENEWHHVAVTYNGTDKRVYIDGVALVTTPATGLLGFNSMAFRIGYTTITANREQFMNGFMDEVRMSRVERSADWIWAEWLNSASNDVFNCYGPVQVNATIDLMVTKSVSETNLLSGTNLTYTIDVMNVGTVAMGGVVVTDSLPAGVVYLGSVPPASETNGMDYRFDIGLLSAAGMTSVVIQVGVTSALPGAITNRALGFTTNAESFFGNNLGTAVTVLPDSDGDGIANPGDPDDDNDGFDDCGEILAGTDPFDPGSFLWIGINPTGSETVNDLIFPSVLSRMYRIEGATNLYTGPWIGVRTNLPGDGSISPNGRHLAYKAMTRPGFEADQYQVVLQELRSGR
ncbi:MAG: LamG-like jellyroll fold domain-containing protein, partial [Verrucomicrobiota bacterium]